MAAVRRFLNVLMRLHGHADNRRDMEPTRTLQANIEVHTRMADSYDTDEPHFRPENQQKVRRTLEELAKRARGGRLLDVGCGTGFIIRLAHDLFESIDGIDITPAMLARVGSWNNVTLHTGAAENMPFADASFDMASSYAFMHHVEDHKRVLKEVARVLRPGGLFYVDLEPNKLFWNAMVDLEKKGSDYSDILTREIDSVLHTDESVENEFGIASQTFKDAEPIKSVLGGFDPEEFQRAAIEAGFASCEVTFDWYAGQGAILHGQSEEAMQTIDAYLRRVLPLSGHLYKYLRFVCIR
ncbi:MAG TPA: class I SAM-dependent methyltransferase [Candidatus Baltobacteraceae bacterium]|nr:class I SAM-dependent methyltransferase [Candidatus Baltobacteraceae bacterium]